MCVSPLVVDRWLSHYRIARALTLLLVLSYRGCAANLASHLEDTTVNSGSQDFHVDGGDESCTICDGDGWARERQQRRAEAERRRKKSAERAAALHREAMTLAERGELARSLPLFRAAVRASPERAQLQSDLGVTEMRLHDFERAHHRFVRAVELDPAFAPAVDNVAELEAFLGPDHPTVAAAARRRARAEAAFAQTRAAMTADDEADGIKKDAGPERHPPLLSTTACVEAATEALPPTCPRVEHALAPVRRLDANALGAAGLSALSLYDTPVILTGLLRPPPSAAAAAAATDRTTCDGSAGDPSDAPWAAAAAFDPPALARRFAGTRVDFYPHNMDREDVHPIFSELGDALEFLAPREFTAARAAAVTAEAAEGRGGAAGAAGDDDASARGGRGDRRDEQGAENNYRDVFADVDASEPGTYVQWNIAGDDWNALLGALAAPPSTTPGNASAERSSSPPLSSSHDGVVGGGASSAWPLPAVLQSDDEWLEACLASDADRDRFALGTHWRMLLVGEPGAGMFNHQDTLRTASWQAQLRGTKRWHLCAADQAPHLYGAGRVDTLDPHGVDYDGAPAFRNASCLRADVRAGELLYYPHDWWHQTRVLSRAETARRRRRRRRGGGTRERDGGEGRLVEQRDQETEAESEVGDGVAADEENDDNDPRDEHDDEHDDEDAGELSISLSGTLVTPRNFEHVAAELERECSGAPRTFFTADESLCAQLRGCFDWWRRTYPARAAEDRWL